MVCTAEERTALASPFRGTEIEPKLEMRLNAKVYSKSASEQNLFVYVGTIFA